MAARATLGAPAALAWLLTAAACGASRTAPPPDPVVSAIRGDTVAAGGMVTVIEVGFPEAGSFIGNRYAGVQFQRRTAELRATEELRRRWGEAARGAADSMLRAAGHPVRAAPAPSSDAERLEGVRFGLAARVLRLDIRVDERSGRAEATAEVGWELLDLVSGRAMLGRSLVETARADSGEGVAALGAVRRSFATLLADSAFARALAAPRPTGIEAQVYGSGYARAMPGERERVALTPDDVNVLGHRDPVVRVGAGLVALRNSDGRMATAFIITRDGLAITSSQVRDPRGAALLARFPTGVVREARVVRRSGRLVLVQVSCPDPCRTVEWSLDGWPPRGTQLFATGAPYADGDAFLVGRGADPGACGLLSGGLRSLRGFDAETTGGEPVARAGDGTVVAVAARPWCARSLRDAFRDLGIDVRQR